MASRDSKVRVIDFCEVAPSWNSGESPTELSLPLTYFDIMWLNFHPVERIFFYHHPDSTRPLFNSVTLPKLKNSLSLALFHFLPLAGNVVWPSDSDKPFILYSPNDAVSLTVAESDADFHHLSEDRLSEAFESHPYVPKLDISETKASIIAFQITLFPDKGFSIGVSSHHAILDGKSVTMFIKAWAHICKLHGHEENPTLPPELTPTFDRTMINDPDRLDMFYLQNWAKLKSQADPNSNPRSLKLLAGLETPCSSNLIRGTFKLCREDIKRLKQNVLSSLSQPDNNAMHLSTFVLTFAYTVTNIVKAKRLERNKRVMFGFTADCRTRLEPPIVDNYFGNCVSPGGIGAEAEVIGAEDGLVFVAERLSEEIKGLKNEGNINEKAKELFTMGFDPRSMVTIGVAGSPRFELYATDFGWGVPRRVVVTSIDRTGSVSLAESSDGVGGVEVGLVLKNHEMEIFEPLFVDVIRE